MTETAGLLRVNCILKSISFNYSNGTDLGIKFSNPKKATEEAGLLKAIGWICNRALPIEVITPLIDLRTTPTKLCLATLMVKAEAILISTSGTRVPSTVTFIQTSRV